MEAEVEAKVMHGQGIEIVWMSFECYIATCHWHISRQSLLLIVVFPTAFSICKVFPSFGPGISLRQQNTR